MNELSSIRGRLPRRNEIVEVATAITAREFPRLVIFSDMISRYVDVRLRGKVNWLRSTALTYLITRGGSLTASQLARLMLRSNYSMTRLIDDLEKDGLVIRERTGKDRRTVDVRITSDGLAFMMQTLSDNDLVEGELMSCLDENEIETLRNLIRVLRQTLILKISKRIDNWTYYYRGISYKHLGKKAEAVADFETCIKHSRDRSLIKAARQELEKLKADNE